MGQDFLDRQYIDYAALMLFAFVIWFYKTFFMSLIQIRRGVRTWISLQKILPDGDWTLVAGGIASVLR